MVLLKMLVNTEDSCCTLCVSSKVLIFSLNTLFSEYVDKMNGERFLLVVLFRNDAASFDHYHAGKCAGVAK